MCYCLAKVVKAHLDFNHSDAWIMQETHEYGTADFNNFTYNLGELKCTINTKQEHQSTQGSSVFSEIDHATIEILFKKPQERKVADEFDSDRDLQEDFYEVRPSENDEIEQFRIDGLQKQIF